jgi:hypothetical protein
MLVMRFVTAHLLGVLLACITPVRLDAQGTEVVARAEGGYDSAFASFSPGLAVRVGSPTFSGLVSVSRSTGVQDFGHGYIPLDRYDITKTLILAGVAWSPLVSHRIHGTLAAGAGVQFLTWSESYALYGYGAGTSYGSSKHPAAFVLAGLEYLVSAHVSLNVGAQAVASDHVRVPVSPTLQARPFAGVGYRFSR